MPEKVKRLRVLAGPNGSGKSTVVFHILDNYNCGYFLNADQLQEKLQKDKSINLADFGLSINEDTFKNYLEGQGSSWVAKAKEQDTEIDLHFKDNHLCVSKPPGGYDAALAADFLRYQLLAKNETFTFETVLSDSRKVDYLEEAIRGGFKIYLYFICTKDPEINVTRVSNRVKLGGHIVPEDKIRDRYHSSLKVLERLVPITHRCFLFDNSEEGNKNEINLVAEIEEGEKLTIRSNDVPQWVQEHVIDKLF